MRKKQRRNERGGMKAIHGRGQREPQGGRRWKMKVSHPLAFDSSHTPQSPTFLYILMLHSEENLHQRENCFLFILFFLLRFVLEASRTDRRHLAMFSPFKFSRSVQKFRQADRPIIKSSSIDQLSQLSLGATWAWLRQETRNLSLSFHFRFDTIPVLFEVRQPEKSIRSTRTERSFSDSKEQTRNFQKLIS